MADIQLNSDYDLLFENDNLVLIEGKDAIAQDVLIRLQFFQGEWVLDARLGVPYFQKILGAKPNLSVVRSILRKVILGTPGIDSINDLSVTFNSVLRLLEISFTAETKDGIIKFNKELII